MNKKTTRLERASKPRKCPKCGFSPLASILYGYPAYSPKRQQAIDEGRTILGGCCVTDDDPAWECSCCGTQIYRPDPFLHPVEDLKP